MITRGGKVQKHAGYSVRIENSFVAVELRSLRWPAAAALFCVFVAFLFLASLAAIGDSSGNVIPLVGGAVMAVASGIGWFTSRSGEVMRCDARELQLAQRSKFSRWRRQHFPASEVRRLRREIRTAGKSAYSVLVFECGGSSYDILTDLKGIDGRSVLKGCAALGLDVDLPNDPGELMLDDIDKRGWFVNPLRTDRKD